VIVLVNDRSVAASQSTEPPNPAAAPFRVVLPLTVMLPKSEEMS
jgi:hypothetical protein